MNSRQRANRAKIRFAVKNQQASEAYRESVMPRKYHKPSGGRYSQFDSEIPDIEKMAAEQFLVARCRIAALNAIPRDTVVKI